MKYVKIARYNVAWDNIHIRRDSIHPTALKAAQQIDTDVYNVHLQEVIEEIGWDISRCKTRYHDLTH